MMTKLKCWIKGHEYSQDSTCPFTGYTYVHCDLCGQLLHTYVKEA